MDNKEVIEKLVKYFREDCDIEVIYRSFANALIDLNRAYSLETLPKSEKALFKKRLKRNIEELHSFLEKGPKHPLICKKVTLDQDF